MTLRRSVASLWIATVLYWPMRVIVSRSWTTPYSWRDDVISALGAATCTDYCSPDHVVMNATFVAVGGATAAGAALLVRPRWASHGRGGSSWRSPVSRRAPSGSSRWTSHRSPHRRGAGALRPAARRNAVCRKIRRSSRLAIHLRLQCDRRGGRHRLPQPGKWGLGSGVTERLALDTLNVWTIGMGVLLLARSWNPDPGIRGR